MRTKVAPNVLNVGCGPERVPPGYQDWEVVTVDIDPRVGSDLVADGRDLAIVGSASFDAVYCSHNLEHYPPEDVQTVLRGFLRVLRPGGAVEVRVPDIGTVRDILAAGAKETDIAYLSGAGPITYRDMIDGWGKQIEAGNDHYRHLTSFDIDSLREALVDAGFSEVSIKIAPGLELIATGRKA